MIVHIYRWKTSDAITGAACIKFILVVVIIIAVTYCLAVTT